MARARNIKPGFFTNEDIVDLKIETRLLFIGLWTLADREGRLQDRPRKIKMEIYPADNFDIDAMLNELDKAKLIIRYVVDNVRYIQVTNFNKHQNPHVKEVESTIPAPCKHHASTVQATLIPDSGFLIPDSGLTLANASVTRAPEKKTKAKKFLPPTASEMDFLRGYGVVGQIALDFLALRKKKSKPLTKTAMDGIAREAKKAGLSVQEAIMICAERSWLGFRADWDYGQRNGSRAPPTTGAHVYSPSPFAAVLGAKFDYIDGETT